MKDALLLSGGIDSFAVAAWKRPAVAITCDYGQLAVEGEIRASRQISTLLGIDHHVVRADCRGMGSGDLAGCGPSPLAPSSEWWPFRNQLLITFACMTAVRLGVERILLGTVRSDGFHVDGTPQFVAAIDNLCSLQEGSIRVSAPAITMTSAELVRASNLAIGDLAWAHSCHVSGWACGRCRGCQKHQMVMQELGYDPY